MKVTITSGSVRHRYKASTGREAVQMFFDEVRAGKIELGDLGFIGEWTDGREHYPFRLTPALVKCGFITFSQMQSLTKLAGLVFTDSEMAEMVRADAWMVRAGSDIDEISTVQ